LRAPVPTTRRIRIQADTIQIRNIVFFFLFDKLVSPKMSYAWLANVYRAQLFQYS
jgi:hypothetical protein